MIRVLLADDHSLFRDGIKSLLNNEKEVAIIGEAEDGKGLVRKYFELKPDVVVTDISMPNTSGPEAAKKILNKDEKAKILFLSQYTEDNYIYEVLKCKAFGLIGKNIVKNELLLAIDSVSIGKYYFVGKTDEELRAILTRFDNIRDKKGDVVLDSLTSRENEVLRAIGDGLTRDEIAGKLKIKVRTIDAHRYTIMFKLGVKRLPELIKFAMDLKIKNEREILESQPFVEN